MKVLEKKNLMGRFEKDGDWKKLIKKGNYY